MPFNMLYYNLRVFSLSFLDLLCCISIFSLVVRYTVIIISARHYFLTFCWVGNVLITFQYHLWDIICKKVFQDLKYLPFSYDYVLFLFPRLRDFLLSSPIPVFQHFRFLLSFSLFRLSFTKIRYFLILFSKILRISDFLLGLPRLPFTRGVGGVLIGAPSNTIVSV